MNDVVTQPAPAKTTANSITDIPTPAKTARYAAALLLGISVSIVVISWTTAFLLESATLAGIGTLCAVVTAGVGLVRGCRALYQHHDVSALAKISMLLAVILNLVMVVFGALVALLSVVNFSRGRQLRRFGRVLLPPVQLGEDWTSVEEAVVVPNALQTALAKQWRENGRTEHASVAAFARLTLDLMALGAPPKLIASANRDALDEIRHTEICFSLARAIDGQQESPGPFPAPQRVRPLPRLRALALAKLAVDSLIDGALHEGVSARIIAKLAQRCSEPAIHAVLKELAADEGRHSAHGWHVVEWCLAEGGRPVAYALRGAVWSLPQQMHSPLPEPASDGSWEQWGIHGHELEATEYAAARAHIAQRVVQLTAALPRVAA